MERHVRGSLFVDYVRMICGHKQVDWGRHLTMRDLALLEEHITPDGWYPMDTFERYGVAILQEIARGQLDAVRMWGRIQVDALHALHPTLLAEDDVPDTIMRFQVIRRGFFDFDAVEVCEVHDGGARIRVRYHMGRVAEEAATWQTLGFFERLVELAGACWVEAELVARSWEGDPDSILALRWGTDG
ncbi:MAG: hypothetical protein ACODAU_05985 [Myxococcota bacterium]